MRGTRKWAHGLWTNSAHPPRPRRQSSSACAVLIVLGKLDISSVTCTATGFAGHAEHPLILHHSATLYWEFLSMSIALDMFFPEKMVLSDSLWCWYERCERECCVRLGSLFLVCWSGRVAKLPLFGVCLPVLTSGLQAFPWRTHAGF